MKKFLQTTKEKVFATISLIWLVIIYASTMTGYSKDTEGFFIIGLGPVVSKGFSFWGKEAFPFVAIPFGLTLNQDNKQYEMRTNIALGIMGKIPVKKLEKLIFNLEADINLNNSFTAVFLGMTYPLALD